MIMLKLRFAEQWVSLIMRCVTSVSFSVLWQGQPMGNFSPTRGIKQGDPLSPYLFFLYSEGLSSLFQNACREGYIHGVQVGHLAPPINHLLFAGSLIFANASMEEAIHLKQCLLLYEAAAGQKVNFQKSPISFGPGVNEATMVSIIDLLGVISVPFHERYLGLPTITGRDKRQMFKIINDRLDFHLSGWQGKLLSKAGKMVLVKAVAQAIPTYTMVVFRLPKGIYNTFISKVSKF